LQICYSANQPESATQLQK